MKKVSSEDICRRIVQIRHELAGSRGKASFARQLGISPTTYQSYEAGRVPSAEVLVRIAELADVDLMWLLTGEEGSGEAVSAGHPVLNRAAKLLADEPNAAAPLAAFLELLAESIRKFPAGSGEKAEVAAGGAVGNERAGWVAVLGRSAAGVPHFWSDENASAGVTTLDELLSRQASQRESKSVLPATAVSEQSDQLGEVQLITLTAPGENAPAEFVAAPGIKTRYDDAFAVRIDGESMSPDIRHGDLVILSPSVPAVGGQPAVVQLNNQIGVTCKLYRHEGETVHLVPINEQFAPQSFSADDLVWALRVIAHIRPKEQA